MANDLQQVGAKALGRAPQPLRRALDGLGIQFKQEDGPTQAMANGHQYGNIAGVAQRDPNTISVMQPDVFRKNADQLVTHEGMHSWQNNLPPAIQNAIPPDNPNDPYNFGGTARIAKLVNSGGKITDLPREQEAAAMQYGQSQGMPEPYKKLANTINDVSLSQIEQTSPDQKGINTKPRAPQVPSASVPGMNYAAATYKPGDPAPGDMTASMLGPMPDLGQPQAPQATYAPSPQQQNIDNDQQQLQKVRFAQANPWGTASNHPGTMGKIAHVLSVAGNIAGNIVAPNIMANIPGTQMNMNVREHGLQNQLDQETGELSQNQARDAGTQATQLANAAEPQKAQDQHGLVQSEIGKNEQEKVPQPNLANAYAHAVQAAITAGKDPSQDPIVQHLADAITSIQKPPAAPKEANPQQQTYDALLKKGMTPEQAYEKIREKPPGASEAGTWSLQEDKDGNPVEYNSKTGQMRPAPVGLQKAGTFSRNTKPTADEQRRADLAENLNENLATLKDIAARRPELFGPISGRLAEMKQKFGSDDPDLGTLQTIAHQIGMAQISAHGMRSAQGIQGASDSILNNLHSGPHALAAAIEAAQKSVGTFTSDVENKGKTPANSSTGGKADFVYVPGKGLVKQ